MPVDLYSVYKGFYDRSYRDSDDDDYSVMTEMIHDLVRNLYIHQYDDVAKEVLRLEGIEISKKLYEMEKSKKNLRRWHSIRLIRALENNDYEIDVPYQVAPRWLENNYFGTLYVLVSNSRPGQCKLGATHMDIDIRVNKYINKYGYEVDLYFYEVDVLNPFNQELAIAKKYSHLRHSGNTYGDSNEWYYLDPEILKNEILSIK